MSIIASPYDQRIQKLQGKLRRGGTDPQNLKLRLAKVQKKQYGFQEKNRPIETPYSSQYETTMGGLTNDLNQTQAGIAGRKLGVEQQYGFGSDTSNPFSVAKQLESQYAQQKAGTQNSYAAQGQLYAGSLSNARNIDATNMLRAQDTAQRNYQGDLADLDAEGLEALRAYREGGIGAGAQRLEDAVNTPLDPSTAPKPPNFAKRIQNLRQKVNQGKPSQAPTPPRGQQPRKKK